MGRPINRFHNNWRFGLKFSTLLLLFPKDLLLFFSKNVKGMKDKTKTEQEHTPRAARNQQPMMIGMAQPNI